MQDFTLRALPGQTTLTIGGRVVDATHVTVETGPDAVPRVTAYTTGEGNITGNGIITVVREPTPVEVHDTARSLLTGVNVQAFEDACTRKVRAGRRDPYKVALEVLGEMLDG